MSNINVFEFRLYGAKNHRHGPSFGESVAYDRGAYIESIETAEKTATNDYTCIRYVGDITREKAIRRVQAQIDDGFCEGSRTYALYVYDVYKGIWEEIFDVRDIMED